MNRDEQIHIPPRGTKRGDSDASIMLGIVLVAVSAAAVISTIIWLFARHSQCS